MGSFPRYFKAVASLAEEGHSRLWFVGTLLKGQAGISHSWDYKDGDILLSGVGFLVSYVYHSVLLFLLFLLYKMSADFGL